MNSWPLPTFLVIFGIYGSRAFQNTQNFEDRPSRTRVRDQNSWQILKMWVAPENFQHAARHADYNRISQPFKAKGFLEYQMFWTRRSGFETRRDRKVFVTCSQMVGFDQTFFYNPSTLSQESIAYVYSTLRAHPWRPMATKQISVTWKKKVTFG